MNYTDTLKAGVGLSLVLAGLSATANAEAKTWFSADVSSACHQYLAYPWATDCDYQGSLGGYRIQKHAPPGTGWVNDTERAMSIAVSSSGYLYAVRANGTVRVKSPTSGWFNMPNNNCGGTGTLTITQDNGTNVIAVGKDAASSDVVWVRDNLGYARFWRTSSTPNCWAAVAALPTLPGGNVGGEIGIYSFFGTPGNLPWMTNGSNLYQRTASNTWVLIDSGTSVLGNQSYQVTGTDGKLWYYDGTTGNWNYDTLWPNGNNIRAVSKGIFSVGFADKAVIDFSNHVWIYG